MTPFDYCGRLMRGAASRDTGRCPNVVTNTVNRGSSPGMSLAPDRSRHRPPRFSLRLASVVVTLVAFLGGLAVATDALGAGQLFDRAVARADRFMGGPPPDRPTIGTILVTPRPTTQASSMPSRGTSSPPRGAAAFGSALPTALPTPEPKPVRMPVDIEISADPASIFASEARNTWCSPAAVQITLAFLGKANT